MQPFVPRPTVVTTHRPAASSKQPLPTSPQQDPSIASQKPDTAAPAPAPKSVPDTAATLVPPASQAETEKGSENAPPPPPQPMGPEQGSPQEDIMVDVTSTMTEQQTRTVLRPPSLHALAQASSYFTSLPFPSLQNVITAVNRKKKLAAQLKKALQPAVGAAIQGKNEPKAGGFPMPPPGARTVLNASTQPPPPPPRRSRHGKARRTAPPQLVVSDARAEHLLIAARRIGRERAGIVAGVISAERERMEREKAEREQERVEREKERVEREKRNRGGGGYYRERPEQRETREEKRAESSSDRRYAHAMAGYVNAAGSSVKRDAHAAKGKGKSAPTAIDSLLSAARSMMDEGHDNSETGAEPPSASISSASTGMMTRRRAANASEPPQTEALPRKRRRLSSNTSHSPTRVRTALDVLADQAAVFSSSGKGKGKGLAEEIAASVEPTVKRKRGRPPNKDRDKIAPAKVSRLISPANAPASPPVAGPSRQGTANLGSTSVIHPRPATRWVQRGRQASSASARAPPRQKDDIESEDEEGEANAEKEQPEEMESRAEPELASKTGPDPVVKPASVIVDDAIPLIQSDAMTECEAPSLPPVIVEDLIVEDPVLDADADGESDPDVDMEGMGGGT
ncbi:hypothetical protein B0H15DRAFT_148680 [Mycena belliarum]|uniref:Uncharacterized protein n=1 Tax=Mycena belliarum TaxID=1033014 RepID=A0AAD6U7M8_9AGAR|nr:hypothetical protein B0H15DRAFT_148680 [Mycena belliae]